MTNVQRSVQLERSIDRAISRVQNSIFNRPLEDLLPSVKKINASFQKLQKQYLPYWSQTLQLLAMSGTVSREKGKLILALSRRTLSQEQILFHLTRMLSPHRFQAYQTEILQSWCDAWVHLEGRVNTLNHLVSALSQREATALPHEEEGAGIVRRPDTPFPEQGTFLPQEPEEGAAILTRPPTTFPEEGT